MRTPGPHAFGARRNTRRDCEIATTTHLGLCPQLDMDPAEIRDPAMLTLSARLHPGGYTSILAGRFASDREGEYNVNSTQRSASSSLRSVLDPGLLGGAIALMTVGHFHHKEESDANQAFATFARAGS